MAQPLKVLIVEDSLDDAEFLLRELRRGGFAPEWQRVDTEAAYLAQLHAGLDLVLSDFRLPQFTGLRALELLKQSGLDVPFIIVSGTVGEEMAVSALKHGATDYLLKDRLARLGTAVTQALEQTRSRRERQLSEAALRESEKRYRRLAENFPNGTVVLFDRDLRTVLADGAGLAEVGLSKTEVEGKTLWEIFPPERCAAMEPDLRAALAGEMRVAEGSFANRAMERRTVPVRNEHGEITGGMLMTQDITARKQREVEIERLNRLYTALSHINQTVARACSREELLHEVCRVMVADGGCRMAWIGWQDPATRTLLPAAQFGGNEIEVERVEIRSEDSFDGWGPIGIAFRESRTCICTDAAGDPSTLLWREELQRRGIRAAAAVPIRLQNKVSGVLAVYSLEVDFFKKKEIALLEEAAADISFALDNLAHEEQRHLAEAALRASEANLAAAQSRAKIGSWEFDLGTHTATWSAEMFRICERDPALGPPSYNEYMQMVHPDERDAFESSTKVRMAGRCSDALAYRIVRPDGSIRWIEDLAEVIRDGAGRPVRLMGTAQDITARTRAAMELQRSEQAQRQLAQQLAAEKIRLIEAQAVAKIGSWENDLASGAVKCSDEIHRIFETDPNSFSPTHHNFLEKVHSEDRSRVEEAFVRSLGVRTACAITYRLLMPDGRIKFAEERWQSFADEKGQPSHTIGTCRDVTEQQQREAELGAAQRQLRALVDRLHTARDEEAKRIARELHDDLGQQLTALNMELDDLEMKLPPATARQQDQIARMRSIVNHTIEAVQQIASALRLGQLDILGLTAAIEWELTEFSRRSVIPCRIIRLDEIVNLTGAQNTTLFRILLEALTNIVRHAAATEVELILQRDAHQVTLMVRDNGRGLGGVNQEDPNALGLLGMRERARLVGGDVTITDNSGAGTTVRVRIPLHPPGAVAS